MPLLGTCLQTSLRVSLPHQPAVWDPRVPPREAPPRPVDFCDHCPSLGETSVAKIVLWPLPGPCELVPTYTCLFFLLFVFGGGSDRPRGAGQIWEIDVFGKDFKETLRGGDTQNLVGSEASETEPGLQERRFIPQGAADSPLPRERPPLELSERWPTLYPGALPPPLPQPQRMRQFTVCIYYCSRSPRPPPLSLGRVCRLADWQEPAVSLVGASITPYLCLDSLCQGQATWGLGTTTQGCLST